MALNNTIVKPLAERMRPMHLSQYIGQEHLLGEGKALRVAIENKSIPSCIFWGPPGVGKTTLALIIAHHLEKPFFSLSAINAGVKEVREVIDRAKQIVEMESTAPILFIDEIHRFSKSQQDSLLGAVEQGVITLIGATTENPSFEVISALLSRCQVYVLKPLQVQELEQIVRQALQEDEVLKNKKIIIEQYEALLQISGGDGRKLLNNLELIVSVLGNGGELILTNEVIAKNFEKNTALYDKNGEQHYDIVSAFIKSIRGSDPNGAVYWLARMIEGGEDPLFIARRLLILASEDIGLANPNALLLANNCFQAVQVIGFPESRIILSQTAIYLALSAKSNSAYMAIGKAQQTVRESGDLPVPLHLRNAPTKLMKNMNYGQEYKYAHDYEGNFVEQEFLPKGMEGTSFYHPAQNAQESKHRENLEKNWKNKYKY